MRIRGIERLTPAEIETLVAAGSRFVFYELCISLVVATLRRPSAVHLLKPGDRGIMRGLPYTAVSLLLGWWGIPWGFVHTPLAIITNSWGGCDVTAEVLRRLRQPVIGTEQPSCAKPGVD